MLEMRRTLARTLIGYLGGVMIAPTAHAAPFDAPVPLGPLLGEPCTDFDKLAYDPAVGQIVCDGSSWARSVEPTGIRNLGAPCGRAEMDSVMANSADGYLIWCPSDTGVWTLYSP